MAAQLRRELGIDVDMVPGHYGEFKVLVDGRAAIDGGKRAILGIVPSGESVVAAVRERLSG